ncbi:MAG TPA: reverse transcriptase family protein [Methylophilaceae bacterium]|nr:reverse transcriptase family protein [Methylophilaceae bacterium]
MASHKIYYSGSPIGSLGRLSKTLDVSEAQLLKIAHNPSAFYVEFEKTVRNKTRSLADPVPLLKTIQKRIITRIFCNIVFPPYLHGGIKSSSPRDFVSNAKAHANAETAIALDIKNFFPSISSAQIEHIFIYLFKFPLEVSKVLTNLTTLNQALPQGAPTSSYLSNLVLFEKEFHLVAKLEGLSLTYTRLIDDITVSSKTPLSKQQQGKIVNQVIGMLHSYGYHIHPTKKSFYSRSNPKNLMQITGLWLNRGSPRISRSKRQEIAYEVNELKKLADTKNGKSTNEYHEQYASVSGKVALLRRLKHKEAVRLRNILDRISPIYSEDQIAKIKKLIFAFASKSQDRRKLGYIQKFYKFQHAASIVARTDLSLAKLLQKTLNTIRPLEIARNING